MQRYILLTVLLLGFVMPCAAADGLILFCYNWNCKTPGVAHFPEPWLKKTLAPLRQTSTPDAERAVLPEVIRRFYAKAGEQLPIAADGPGNEEDETVDGRMDCIDHSSTTRNILSFLAHRQALKWHSVGPYAHRTIFLDSHYSATIIEAAITTHDDRQIFVIDPWFVAQGDLPPILPVREWASYRFYSLEADHHTAAAHPVARR